MFPIPMSSQNRTWVGSVVFPFPCLPPTLPTEGSSTRGRGLNIQNECVYIIYIHIYRVTFAVLLTDATLLGGGEQAAPFLVNRQDSPKMAVEREGYL